MIGSKKKGVCLVQGREALGGGLARLGGDGLAAARASRRVLPENEEGGKSVSVKVAFEFRGCFNTRELYTFNAKNTVVRLNKII